MIPADAVRSYQDLVVRQLEFLQQGGQLTDTSPGSIVRTLVEAFTRELVELYAQNKIVYDSGYLATAEGPSLDLLVDLLGVERIAGQSAQGVAIFVRDQRVPGTIEILSGCAASGSALWQRSTGVIYHHRI